MPCRQQDCSPDGNHATQAEMQHAPSNHSGPDSDHTKTDADIRDAIRAYLADPEFHAYVDRVELLWASIEDETFEQEEQTLDSV